jgi:hypothetical protein
VEHVAIDSIYLDDPPPYWIQLNGDNDIMTSIFIFYIGYLRNFDLTSLKILKAVLRLASSNGRGEALIRNVYDVAS